MRRGDFQIYALAQGLAASGPPVAIPGGEYTLFVDSESNNGTLSLQVRQAEVPGETPGGTWIDCRDWGLQIVQTNTYSACISGLKLAAGSYRIRAQGLVLNLHAYLVGNG